MTPQQASAPIDQQAGGSARENSFAAVHELKDYFDRELNLPLRDSGAHQHARGPTGIAWRGRQGCSGGIENVGIAIAGSRGSEVRMIENIEHLDAELDVEVLGDSLDVVVLENREVQTRNTRADQDIAAGISAQVETLQRSGVYGTSDARWLGITIRIPKRGVGSGRDAEALSLDVVARIAGICKHAASRSPQAVRVSKIVAAQRIGRITAGAPGGCEGHSVADGEDSSKLPTIGNPAGWAGEGFGSWNIPSAIDDQRAPDVEVGGPAGQFHVEPVEAGNRIVEGVAGESGRAGVHAFSPGVCALHLEAMAHALGQLQFESVEVRASLIKHSANGTKVGVDGIGRDTLGGVASIGISLIALRSKYISKDIHLGPEIALGGLGGDDQVGFVHAEGLMHAARTDVGNHGGQALGELVLDIEVPLGDVITLRVRIDIRGTQPVPSNVLGWHSRKGKRRGEIGVVDLEGRVLEKRNGLSLQKDELVGKRKNIEQASAAADSHLAVAKWIPGETDARFKVAQCGVGE